MDITILTPTTNSPFVLDAILSVQNNGLYDNHWLITDGITEPPIFYHKNTIQLPVNTGKSKVTGRVMYFGHRIYSAMSFAVNTKWMMFLDEDNCISDDFAEKLEPFLQANDDAPFVTYRRKILDSKGDFMCYDDFESVPENMFADTGCVVWNTRFYATRIAHCAFAGGLHDKNMYMTASRYINYDHPPHLHEYLLEYTSPERNIPFFMEHGRK